MKLKELILKLFRILLNVCIVCLIAYVCHTNQSYLYKTVYILILLNFLIKINEDFIRRYFRNRTLKKLLYKVVLYNITNVIKGLGYKVLDNTSITNGYIISLDNKYYIDLVFNIIQNYKEFDVEIIMKYNNVFITNNIDTDKYISTINYTVSKYNRAIYSNEIKDLILKDITYTSELITKIDTLFFTYLLSIINLYNSENKCKINILLNNKCRSYLQFINEFIEKYKLNVKVLIDYNIVVPIVLSIKYFNSFRKQISISYNNEEKEFYFELKIFYSIDTVDIIQIKDYYLFVEYISLYKILSRTDY